MEEPKIPRNLCSFWTSCCQRSTSSRWVLDFMAPISYLSPVSVSAWYVFAATPVFEANITADCGGCEWNCSLLIACYSEQHQHLDWPELRAAQALFPLIYCHILSQEGFSSSEVFLYKFLNIWDGSFLRQQILGLLSNIPVVPSSREFCLWTVSISKCSLFLYLSEMSEMYTVSPTGPCSRIRMQVCLHEGYQNVHLCITTFTFCLSCFRNWAASFPASHAALLHILCFF